MLYTCYCGDTKTEPIDKIPEHEWDEEWECHDNLQHKQACPCGEIKYQYHSYDSYDDTRIDPDCNVCGYMRDLGGGENTESDTSESPEPSTEAGEQDEPDTLPAETEDAPAPAPSETTAIKQELPSAGNSSGSSSDSSSGGCSGGISGTVLPLLLLAATAMALTLKRQKHINE